MALAHSAFGYYYDTLPAGVRMLIFRDINSTPITSKLDSQGRQVDMKVEVDASSKELESLNDAYVNAFLELYKQYPKAFEALSLGKFKASAKANVEAKVYGFAYGITNKLTAYAGLPIYKARVDMRFNKVSSSNFSQVAEILQSHTGDDYAQGLGNITQSFYELDGTLMQSLVVNGYGYEEVGSWNGEGPGDLELGLLYNFYKSSDFGLLLTLGTVAPTGYVDDPDLLQDIGFGDGQWDVFVEFGGDYVFNSIFSTYAWSRYTHQLASEKELRVPTSAEFPLSDKKGTFEEKLGDTLLTAIGTDFVLTDWTTLNFEYQTFSRQQALYESEFTDANVYLAENTSASKQIFKTTLVLSSVTPFLKNNFILPATLKFSYEKLLEGTNVPNNDLMSIEFRMMF